MFHTIFKKLGKVPMLLTKAQALEVIKVHEFFNYVNYQDHRLPSKDIREKELSRFLIDAKSKLESAFSKKFLVSWNNSGSNNGWQVVNLDFITPEKFMGK